MRYPDTRPGLSAGRISRRRFLETGGSALAGAALLGTLAGCGESGGRDASGATEFTFSFGPDNSGSLKEIVAAGSG